MQSTALDSATLTLVTRWVCACYNEHEECLAARPVIEPGTPLFPTRLLEVGDYRNPVLRIVYTKHIRVPFRYVALTHCWGSQRFTTLTTANHDAFLTSIPWEELTATFQDAIHMVRCMRPIRWIWIDSLCIIQDDAADWNRESVRMQDIYTHAVFTIAAAKAEDGRGGLGVYRDPSLIAPLSACFARPRTWRTMLDSRLGSMPESTLVSKLGSMLRWLVPPVLPNDPPDGEYVCVDQTVWAREVDSSAVSRRAWVAQERFLSPRVVFFSKTQAFFSCAEMRACELYPLGCPPSMYVDDIFAQGAAMLRRLALQAAARVKSEGRLPGTSASEERDGSRGANDSGSDSDDDDGDGRRALQRELLGVWGRLVKTYSNLDLTRPTDKLPAIAGIAQRFAPYFGLDVQYAAGLWQDPLGILTTLRKCQIRIPFSSLGLPRDSNGSRGSRDNASE